MAHNDGCTSGNYMLAFAMDDTVGWFRSYGWPPSRTIDRLATVVIFLVPTYLFVLLAAGLRRRRDITLVPIALACTVQELYTVIIDALGEVQFTGISIGTALNFGSTHLGTYRLNLWTQLEAAVLVAMVWTVYREQARDRKRQLFVESEMKSAQEIQQVLVPEDTPAVPGFAVSSLYWPAGEVGGDMFQVIPGKDGDLTLMIADVSGKGLKAAMTVCR